MKFAELRIKIKSLAAEAQIIRSDERKVLKRARSIEARTEPASRDPKATASLRDTHHSLRLHRVHDVRNEARASLLAYAYLRGMPYAKVETPPRMNVSDWKDRRRFTPVEGRIVDLVAKYGPHDGQPDKARRTTIKDAIGVWFESQKLQQLNTNNKT